MAGWNMKTLQERIELKAGNDAKNQAKKLTFDAIPAVDINLQLSSQQVADILKSRDKNGTSHIKLSRYDYLKTLEDALIKYFYRENVDNLSEEIMNMRDSLEEIINAASYNPD